MILQTPATLITMSVPHTTQCCFISCCILLHIYKQNEINVKLVHFQMMQTKRKLKCLILYMLQSHILIQNCIIWEHSLLENQ
jgi:hypothetical protein